MRTPVILHSVCSLFIALGVGCAGAAALAQPEKVPEPLVRAEPAQSAQTPDAQQRKAALRAALKAQREAGNLPAEKSTRQLNPQERANLREQLRQQRSEAGREKS